MVVLGWREGQPNVPCARRAVDSVGAGVGDFPSFPDFSEVLVKISLTQMVVPFCLFASSAALAGKASDDAVTAKLRDTFKAAAAPTQTQLNSLTNAGGWDCSFHATTNAIVFRGYDDVDYHSTFHMEGVLLDEKAEDVRSGDLAIDPWDVRYAATASGARADGHYFSQVIRLVQDGTLAVEWSYNAAADDQRGDDSLAATGMHTAAYSVCASASGLN